MFARKQAWFKMQTRVVMLYILMQEKDKDNATCVYLCTMYVSMVQYISQDGEQNKAVSESHTERRLGLPPANP